MKRDLRHDFLDQERFQDDDITPLRAAFAEVSPSHSTSDLAGGGTMGCATSRELAGCESIIMLHHCILCDGFVAGKMVYEP